MTPTALDETKVEEFSERLFTTYTRCLMRKSGYARSSVHPPFVSHLHPAATSGPPRAPARPCRPDRA